MLGSCKDPDDNPILAIALESKADFLVTGDKRDLLSMQRIGVKPVVSAAHFIALLEPHNVNQKTIRASEMITFFY